MRRLLDDTNRCLCSFKMAEYDDVQNEAAAFILRQSSLFSQYFKQIANHREQVSSFLFCTVIL